MARANTSGWRKTLLIECLEARQMLAAQPSTGSSAAENVYANAAKSVASAKPIVTSGATTGSTTSLDVLSPTSLSGASTTSADSSSSAPATVEYSTNFVAATAASVWQSGSNAFGASSITLNGLTSPDAAPDPIRFLSLGTGTPLSDHSTSPFAQASVLEWHPSELAGDPSSVVTAAFSKTPDPAGATQLQSTHSAPDSQQRSPTIFGEQWGAGPVSSGRWALRDGRSSDGLKPQADGARPSRIHQSTQKNSAHRAARGAAVASMSEKAFDALAYFAHVGGAIGTAADANTALTAQRIQDILMGCRQATVNVIEMSLSKRLSASTKAAALLVATALASRAARPRSKRKESASLTDQELLAASGIAMSSTWLCFGMGSPRRRRGSGPGSWG